MNQQRSRRFKAIKESKEKAQKEAEILQEMIRMGKEIPPKEDKPHVRCFVSLFRSQEIKDLPDTSDISLSPFFLLLFVRDTVRLQYNHPWNAFYGQSG